MGPTAHAETTLMAGPDMARRLLRKADGTDHARPDIIVSGRALGILRDHTDYMEVGDGQADTSLHSPLVAVRSRVRTSDEATLMRLRYLRIYRNLAAYTPCNRRLDLLARRTHTDRYGTVCVYLSGVVVDWRETSDGRIARVCLMSPSVTDRGDRASFHPIDSHLWLMGDLLRTKDADYLATDDPLRGVPRTDGALHLGDTVVIAARLRSYVDAHGRRRFGIGEWTPLTRGLLYGLTYKDGAVRSRCAPKHLSDQLTVLKVRADGEAWWRDPAELQAELDADMARHKDTLDRSVTVTERR